MNQYFKNFILCGDIDFYCLMCQESFNITKNVDKHIRWEKHRKEIKSLEYVPKFRKDNIYKIKDLFYCEICNLTTKVPVDHITGDNHQNKKQNKNEISQKLSLIKFENGVISVNNVNTTKLQWHGVYKRTCSVCSDTVEQANTHIQSFNHMVNLIQSTIKCKNNKCYRELPKNMFYCFTCNKPYDIKLLTSHLNTKCDEESKANSCNKSNKDDNNNNFTVNILAMVYKDSFSVDIKEKTALCLKCNETVAAVSTAMSKHKSGHMEEDGDVGLDWYFDHGKRRSELAKYGRENYINLNERGCKGYCSLCDIFLSAHINIAKQHVHGALHRGFLELKGLVQDQKHEKMPCRMVPHKTFVDDMFGPFKIGESTVVCINDGICVDLLSYMLIKVINDFKGPKSKCFACDLKLNFKDILHFRSKEHLNILYACKVLIIETDGDEEFIREIRPGLYHCGFCNKVFAFWENINKHLKTFPHKVQKQKKKLMSIISAKMLLNPLCPIELIEEYQTLRSLDCFQNCYYFVFGMCFVHNAFVYLLFFLFTLSKTILLIWLHENHN